MRRLFTLYFSDHTVPKQQSAVRNELDQALRNGSLEACPCGPLKIAVDPHPGLPIFTAFINCSCGRQRGKTLLITLK